jgi:hypothetical protein
MVGSGRVSGAHDTGGRGKRRDKAPPPTFGSRTRMEPRPRWRERGAAFQNPTYQLASSSRAVIATRVVGTSSRSRHVWSARVRDRGTIPKCGGIHPSRRHGSGVLVRVVAVEGGVEQLVQHVVARGDEPRSRTGRRRRGRRARVRPGPARPRWRRRSRARRRRSSTQWSNRQIARWPRSVGRGARPARVGRADAGGPACRRHRAPRGVAAGWFQASLISCAGERTTQRPRSARSRPRSRARGTPRDSRTPRARDSAVGGRRRPPPPSRVRRRARAGRCP